MNFHGTSKSQCWFQLKFLEFSPPKKKKGKMNLPNFDGRAYFFSEGGWFKFNQPLNEELFNVYTWIQWEFSIITNGIQPWSRRGSSKLGTCEGGSICLRIPGETSAGCFFFMTSDCKWDFPILEHILEKNTYTVNIRSLKYVGCLGIWFDSTIWERDSVIVDSCRVFFWWVIL